MRNKYSGICYYCGRVVLPGEGHFERRHGKWRVIHADCVFRQRTMKEKRYARNNKQS